ncbi:TonB-dependent receptor [Parapedobacter koreensis]|uniref:Outer membrane receptor for ferrienterochelin and colicins n=1 Tax=Parapedobacter koreensis TaxID=332977 RepID=A0A1H7JPA9_9SPHI|nr:TonB-dependent receptor [Parapedobacter koreensis]SEK76498.1 outer membrane receptor for ferrienterochelin and colicins [Parapedobacter koreensis]
MAGIRECLSIILIGLAFHGEAQVAGTLDGRVADSKGRPVLGATVLLEPDRHLIQTDSVGEFRVEGLYPGIYLLQVTHTGFRTFVDSVMVGQDENKAIAVTLLAGDQTIGEVNVTGDRSLAPTPDNLIRLDRAAMPMQIITRRQIELMGSRRLDEVLKEQTGVAIVNNISGGSRSVGVQLQGFSSEYVMVLIDGQPMVGRNSGNFDLSRISVSNIERIEIVKGASSCLFGSEALGGAINIITRYGAVQPQASTSVSYGSLNIVDATVDGEAPFHHQRGSATVSANYYRTDGFNTNPYLSSGATSAPYDNYGIQGRVRYRLTKNSTIGTSVRYGLRKSYMPKDWGDGWVSGDSQDEQDLNLSASFDHTFRSGLRSMSRYYFTRYTSDMSVLWEQQQSVASSEVFGQSLHRFEQQFALSIPDAGIGLTGGLGGSLEKLDEQALGDIRHMATTFGYVQGDWQVSKRFSALGGLRYDYTQYYGGRLNPSLGVQYQIDRRLLLKAGVGTGFKAPDFRMRYLVFYNPAANYLVIGNDLLGKTLQQLQDNGQISELRQYIVDQLNQNLQAERNTSWNAGLVWNPSSWVKVEGGVFYHQLRNQINAVLVATGTAVGQIYSYQNLSRATNKGAEATINLTPVEGLDISVGYQYLISRDLSVVDSIRTGHWPYNQNIHNPITGESFSPKASDYWGIENRSRHMLNARVFYTYRPWDASMSVRINYRGKYPFADYNGNQFIDRFDTFVPEHTLLNMSMEKKWMQQRLSIRLTVDNLLDFKHMLMPGQPGRLFIAGITYRWYR